MYKVMFSFVVCLAGLSMAPASAAPIGNPSGLGNDTLQLAQPVACDRRGRCYRNNRYIRRNVARSYRGYAAPYNAYGYDRGYSYGGPGIGFGLGVGRRW
jgi:hypothetical protein